MKTILSRFTFFITDKPTSIYYDEVNDKLDYSDEDLSHLYYPCHIYLLQAKTPIEVGDWYVAEKNTGKHLLQCEEVKSNYLISTVTKTLGKGSYPYDFCDCRKVVASSDETLEDSKGLIPSLEDFTCLDFITYYNEKNKQ